MTREFIMKILWCYTSYYDVFYDFMMCLWCIWCDLWCVWCFMIPVEPPCPSNTENRHTLKNIIYDIVMIFIILMSFVFIKHAFQVFYLMCLMFHWCFTPVCFTELTLNSILRTGKKIQNHNSSIFHIWFLAFIAPFTDRKWKKRFFFIFWRATRVKGIRNVFVIYIQKRDHTTVGWSPLPYLLKHAFF